MNLLYAYPNPTCPAGFTHASHFIPFKIHPVKVANKTKGISFWRGIQVYASLSKEFGFVKTVGMHYIEINIAITISRIIVDT